jgi:hypothetical protein
VSWRPDYASLLNVRGTHVNTPFLTEQSPRIYDMIQRQSASISNGFENVKLMVLSILSPLHDGKGAVVRHSEDELMESLKLVALGSSSPLYIWSVSSESFIHKCSTNTEPITVWVSGQTEAAGTRYACRTYPSIV